MIGVAYSPSERPARGVDADLFGSSQSIQEERECAPCPPPFPDIALLCGDLQRNLIARAKGLSRSAAPLK